MELGVPKAPTVTMLVTDSSFDTVYFYVDGKPIMTWYYDSSVKELVAELAKSFGFNFVVGKSDVDEPKDAETDLEGELTVVYSHQPNSEEQSVRK